MDNNYIIVSSVCCIGWILMVILFRLFLIETKLSSITFDSQMIFFILFFCIISIILLFFKYSSIKNTFKKLTFKSTLAIVGSSLFTLIALISFLYLLQTKQNKIWSVFLTFVVPILGIAILGHLFFNDNINYIGWILMIVSILSIIGFYKYGLKDTT